MMDTVTILTCDGIVMCADCPFRDTANCDKYQDELTTIGCGDDINAPAMWNLQTAEIAGCFSPREL